MEAADDEVQQLHSGAEGDPAVCTSYIRLYIVYPYIRIYIRISVYIVFDNKRQVPFSRAPVPYPSLEGDLCRLLPLHGYLVAALLACLIRTRWFRVGGDVKRKKMLSTWPAVVKSLAHVCMSAS